MNISLLLVQVYLASILGVSGLAKAVNPKQFASTLQYQRILPEWSIDWISYLVPWLEITLAILLVMGVLPIAVSMITMLIFISFFGRRSYPTKDESGQTVRMLWYGTSTKS